MTYETAQLLKVVQKATQLKIEGATGRALGNRAIASLSEDVMENWSTVCITEYRLIKVQQHLVTQLPCGNYLVNLHVSVLRLGLARLCSELTGNFIFFMGCLPFPLPCTGSKTERSYSSLQPFDNV